MISVYYGRYLSYAGLLSLFFNQWAGLNYAEATFEKITDLITANIDFEKPLRKYYRREQLPPAQNARRNIIKRKIAAEVMKIPPEFSHSELKLRDYQWEGVRWLLFNWSQRRSSILADGKAA